VDGVSESDYLSSKLCNLHKSVDESYLNFEASNHPQIYVDYTDEMKPEPTMDADPAYRGGGASESKWFRDRRSDCC
jgi:hypothetical protein